VISVEEAQERILARIAVLGDERVELGGALGRVLAEPVLSHRDVPPWPNSSMDGYALSSRDTAAATAAKPARLAVAGRVAAGTVATRPLGPGEAFRIFTGAPLPEGADAVIPQEEVREDGTAVLVPRAVEPGQFVRPRGEDMKTGDAVLEQGTRHERIARGKLIVVPSATRAT